MRGRGMLVAVVVAVTMAACTAAPTPDEPVTPSPSPSPVMPAKPGVPTRPVAEHLAPVLPGVDSPDRPVVRGDDVSGLPVAPGEDLAAYWDQELVWRDCAPAQCATVLVPLDWENPGLAALEISVTRLRSRTGILGPLFFNPGGPGGAAGPVIRGMEPDLLPGFDLVGWDPRGVGESTAVRCAPEALTAAYEADGSPDDEAERVMLRQAWQSLAESCRELSGVLLEHVSTVEVARDLDLLRHLFKVPRTSYLGISYGSLLGATYAELFPERVGRMVLDGAVEVTGERPLVSLAGLERALGHFANWCGTESSCPLGDSGAEVVERISGLLQRLDRAPLSVGSRTLTQGLAARGVAGSLYWGEHHYPGLATDIMQAIDGDGAGLLFASDLNTDYDDGWLQAASALPAVVCADRPDRGFLAALEELVGVRAEAPVFAASLGTQPMCEFWTAWVQPPLQLRGEGAPPILVIGRTGDPVTPLENSARLSERLESAQLLTVDGIGHVSLNRRDPCVERAVARYLTLGILPGPGESCPG
ncbi:alpha/beta hydrolase [Arachnia propionica]|uniref:Alpha/beta hydrolase n=1 Tax=Arachnia propionica TaxID=1750 RepID=A0A3P1T8P5_9ACTN|nr:alpha/beta hydrolase [Arachnia propionica]RRD05216.1 alpha/beta hydrolase [Arachnia propionica]